MQDKIWSRLFKHYQTAVEHFGNENVLGVFLYGSQNYQCDLPTSDIDTKCILLPDLYHLAVAKYDVKHLAVDDEVCECMTIMHMVSNWKKQNSNFLEIMFTDYFLINPNYLGIWETFIHTWREKIARYNVCCGIKSICGQALHTIRQNPYDGKKIGNGYRLLCLLDKYEQGAPYGECLVPDCAALVKEYKAGMIQPLASTSEDLLRHFEKHMREADNYPPENKSLKPILDNFILELLQKRIMG